MSIIRQFTVKVRRNKSRLDYCNSVLAALPTSTLQPLQRVQNADARLVFGLSRFEHVTPTRIQLHWLPVSYRIKFKLCCLVHAIHYGRSPAYLTETVQSVGASRSRSRLRSSSLHLIDGLLSTTAAHEVRRAGVLTCGSCHLERSARPHPRRGSSCQVPKTAEITLF